MRFGTLEFLILEGSHLELVGSAPQVPPPTDSDMVAETLEGLRLDALEAHALESVPAPVFNYGRLEHQLDAFLRPRPYIEELCFLTFSFANAMVQLTGGEPFSLEHLTRGAPASFPFGLRNAAGTVGHLVV